MKLAAYFLYCICWDCGIIGFAAYIVFWRGRSAWWLLAAAILATMGGFRPQTVQTLMGQPELAEPRKE